MTIEFKPSEWFAETCFDPDERPFIKVHGWLCGDEDFHELEMSDLDQIIAGGGEYAGIGEFHVFQRNGSFMLVPKYQLDAKEAS